MDMDMDMDQYTILETYPNSASPRTKHLQQARARSHAAVIGRRRADLGRDALNNAPQVPGSQAKPHSIWTGKFRLGPSPRHLRRDMPTKKRVVFRGDTSPRYSPVQVVNSIHSTAGIAGSWADGTSTHTTCAQPPHSFQDGLSTERERPRTVSKPTMSPVSSSGTQSNPPLQFIQYNSTGSAPDSSHAVRSNAVRYQWKRSKEARPWGRKTKVSKTSDVPAQPSQQGFGPREKHKVNDDVNKLVQRGEADPQFQAIVRENHDLMRLFAPARNSALQPGGYPTELPSQTVAPLLHLVFEMTNKAFIGDQAPSMSGVAARYVQQLRSHPASFHAAVWVCAKGTLEHSPNSSSLAKQRRFLDGCHQLAVKSVIKMIADLSHRNYVAPTDELGRLCSAMQSLALGTTDDVPVRKVRSGPRQSTLKKLQNLHVWGVAPRWLNYHEEAARKILDANDCTDPLWAGLRVCQTQNDIISSCRTLSKPRSPCGFLNADFAERYNKVMFQMEPRNPPGFMKYAATLLPAALSESLMSVISEIILYNDIQEAFLSNRLTWFGIEYVCDARNWTQHQVMSLPSSEDTAALTNHSQQAAVFDAVRHALIVYSLIAVLPLPLSSVPFPELADMLASDISAILQFDQGVATAPLLLWISSMAALAAIGTPTRSSLVASAARLCRKLQISDWDSMQATLQDYLWSGDISDFDGIYLFLEIEQLMLNQDAKICESFDKGYIELPP